MDMKNRMNESQRRGIIESCLVSGAYRKSGPEWLSFLHSLAFLSLFRFFSHFSFFLILSLFLSLYLIHARNSVSFSFFFTHMYTSYILTSSKSTTKKVVNLEISLSSRLCLPSQDTTRQT